MLILPLSTPSSGGLPPGVTSPGDGALNYVTGALTASRPSINVEQTWNAAGQVFEGIVFRALQTANAAGSRALSVYGGSAGTGLRASINLAGDGNSATLSVQGPSNGVAIGLSPTASGVPQIGFCPGDGNTLFIGKDNGQAILRMRAVGLSDQGLDVTGRIFLTGTPGEVGDAGFHRGGPNKVAQRNGLNPQAYELFNRYTDPSNFERGFLRWNSDVFEIGTETLAGTERAMRIVPGSLNTGYVAGNTLKLGNDDIYSQYGWTYYQHQGNGRALSGPTVIGIPGSTAGYIAFVERTDPTVGADQAGVYARDNGAGKTQLCVRFPTGAVQVIATEA